MKRCKWRLSLSRLLCIILPLALVLLTGVHFAWVAPGLALEGFLPASSPLFPAAVAQPGLGTGTQRGTPRAGDSPSGHAGPEEEEQEEEEEGEGERKIEAGMDIRLGTDDTTHAPSPRRGAEKGSPPTGQSDTVALAAATTAAKAPSSKPLVTRMTFFIPPNHGYDCRDEKRPVTGYTGVKTCGDLAPLPKEIPSTLTYCGTPAKGYPTHYYYFAHAMLLQKRLEEITGVHMEPVHDPFSADIVFCRADGAATFRNETRRLGHPEKPLLILVEDHDAGTMVAPLSVLRDPSTVAALKHYSWKGHGGMCPNWSKRMYRHIELLRLFEEGRVPSGPLRAEQANALVERVGCERWPAEVERKFMIVTPQWLTIRRGSIFPPFKDLLPIHKRPVDIAFAGTTNYSAFGESEPWQQLVSRYRETFLKNLRAACKDHKWKVEFFTSPTTKHKFFELLRRTKIFISPWGLGEWSGKDEESILSGAVLLKPGASVFQSAIPMYEPGVTCLDARPDGADLKDVLSAALAKSNFPTLQKMQAHAHSVQKEYVSYGKAVKHPEVLKQWAELVRRAQVALR